MLLERALLCAGLVALSVPAIASTDKPTSPQVVVITKMEHGDVACYLTFKNSAGKSQNVLGVHKICSQVELLNKRSKIRFNQAKVAGDKCEGDPQCKDLKTVWVVDSATAVAEFLCPKDEVLYHGCVTTKGEIISFCTRGKFQYQFDKAPSYLVVRTGTTKKLNMKVASSPKNMIETKMGRYAGANSRLLFRWKYASKSYLFESAYLNGARLHGLSIYQQGKRLAFQACFDHQPGKETPSTLDDF